MVAEVFNLFLDVGDEVVAIKKLHSALERRVDCRIGE